MTINIREYDPDWVTRFDEIALRLRDALGMIALRIDHIGSTAIPQLAAKPIIDVQISVASLEPVGAYADALWAVGFVWREDNPERTKRYFREIAGARRTHIHLRQRGSWNEQFSLLFRDYLRSHSADRHRYEAEKRALAARFPDDRKAYSAGKEPVIWDIMQRADRWAKRTGWMVE